MNLNTNIVGECELDSEQGLVASFCEHCNVSSVLKQAEYLQYLSYC
jgi:hypothetical protein